MGIWMGVYIYVNIAVHGIKRTAGSGGGRSGGWKMYTSSRTGVPEGKCVSTRAMRKSIMGMEMVGLGMG